MMGCVNSKTDINDRHPNIFHVLNVNDQGRPRSSGKLEVTESEIVFHQKGVNPLRWPLWSLRKYGFDTQVFTFECGRRSPTGPGIYAFRCRKAEQLFNILQQHITGNVPDENSVLMNSFNQHNVEFSIPTASTGPAVQRIRRAGALNPGTGSEEGYLNPIQPVSRPHNAVLSRPGSISSNGQISPTNISPPAVFTPLENNNYRRESIIENGRGPPSYANLSPDILAEYSNNHVYMNVDTNDLANNVKEDFQEEVHCYANINAKDIESLQLLQKQNSFEAYSSNSVPPTPTMFPDAQDYVIPIREVNYAELDLDNSRTSDACALQSPSAPLEASGSPTQKKKGYVTIDFPKTIALSNSINPALDLEEGSRKTRHNSTINSFSD